MKLRKLIGQLIFIAGLQTVVGAIVLSQGFQPPPALVVGGTVAMLVGYSIQGWHSE